MNQELAQYTLMLASSGGFLFARRDIFNLRKPKFKFLNQNKWVQWITSLPNNGETIKITWLPNPRNHPNTPNCYIGMEGKVEDLNIETGNFVLNTGSSLLIVNCGGNFDYERI